MVVLPAVRLAAFAGETIVDMLALGNDVQPLSAISVRRFAAWLSSLGLPCWAAICGKRRFVRGRGRGRIRFAFSPLAIASLFALAEAEFPKLPAILLREASQSGTNTRCAAATVS